MPDVAAFAARLSHSLEQAQPSWLVAGVIAHAAIQPVAATQWWQLLPPVRWRAVLGAFSIASVANNTTNSLIGHAAGTALVAAIPGVGTAPAVTMLALDQLCVGFAKILVLFGALQLAAASPDQLGQSLPAWLSIGLRSVLLAVGVLAAVVVIGTYGVAARLIGSQAATSNRVLRWLASLAQAIRAVSPTRLAVAAACALGVKLCEAAGITAVQAAFGFAVTPLSVLLVLAATTVATFVPVLPANLGAYEAAVYAALVVLGVPADAAITMAVVQHVVQLTAAIGPGLVVSGRRVFGRPERPLN